MADVGCPEYVRGNVPPVGEPLSVTVCCSLTAATPGVLVEAVTEPPVLVRLAPLAVISATSVAPRVPPNVTVQGPPAEQVTVMSPASMFDRASSAASTVAALASKAIPDVV